MDGHMKKIYFAIVILFCLTLSACGPSPAQVTATLMVTQSQAGTAVPTLAQKVINADVGDLLLKLEQLPGPYAFNLENYTLRSNAELTAEAGPDPSVAQYLKDSGRVTGAYSAFRPDAAKPGVPDELVLSMVIFTSPNGTETLHERDGGPCRPNNPKYADFKLEQQNLGIGDWSALCSKEGTLWYRFGLRNVYFDITAQGNTGSLDRDYLLKVAAAQLAKLQSFPLSDTYSITPAPAATGTPSSN